MTCRDLLCLSGNIRLEDGKPSDVWYSSCVELLHSRFFQRDFAPLGVKGVKVHRVTRVHNRFLRNRFDKRMSTVLGRNQSLGGGAGGQGKAPRRSLEYLFFSVPTHTPLSSPTASASTSRHLSGCGCVTKCLAVWLWRCGCGGVAVACVVGCATAT